MSDRPDLDDLGLTTEALATAMTDAVGDRPWGRLDLVVTCRSRQDLEIALRADGADRIAVTTAVAMATAALVRAARPADARLDGAHLVVDESGAFSLTLQTPAEDG